MWARVCVQAALAEDARLGSPARPKGVRGAGAASGPASPKEAASHVYYTKARKLLKKAAKQVRVCPSRVGIVERLIGQRNPPSSFICSSCSLLCHPSALVVSECPCRRARSAAMFRCGVLFWVAESTFLPPLLCSVRALLGLTLCAFYAHVFAREALAGGGGSAVVGPSLRAPCALWWECLCVHRPAALGAPLFLRTTPLRTAR